jgi:hypothetical protein
MLPHALAHNILATKLLSAVVLPDLINFIVHLPRWLRGRTMYARSI